MPSDNVENLKPSSLRTRTELLNSVMEALADATPEDRVTVLAAASSLCADDLRRVMAKNGECLELGMMIPRGPGPGPFGC